jgi:hypothetical protein
MANDVFANNREVSCKKADGKTICEFPDVCFTPPENPATPPGVPVPYPNTAFAKDTTQGSKTVKISGQEVMLKNKSYFKTSTGDEAGCAAKKGIITSKIKGKAYFISWSMDVKFEGENVVRHLDLTTNNHASPVANGSVPQGYVDGMYVPDMATVESLRNDGKCECCGNTAHSEAQANGQSISEDDWYDTSNPKNKEILDKVRGKCPHLLPDPSDDKCNKYYVTTTREKKRIENDWNMAKADYYAHTGIPAGTDIAHRVPKAAGGCPFGLGNLAETKTECAELETEISALQGKRIQSLRKTLGK